MEDLSFVILGYLGTVLINIAYLPQIVKLIKTKDVSGLSVPMYFVLIVAGWCWMLNGVYTMNIPLVICNLINIIQSTVILIFIKKYKK